jgi:hypothetical protein
MLTDIFYMVQNRVQHISIAPSRDVPKSSITCYQLLAR